MTAYAADHATNRRPTETRRTVVRAELALLVAAATWTVVTVVGFTATLTPDGHHFRHTADYLLTAPGIVGLPAVIAFLGMIHSLQAGRDGRLGRIGLRLTGVSLATITAILVYSVAVATTSGTGPLYPIAAFASDLGMLLFCIGAYRARLLPRTLALVWLIAWIIGGVLSPTWGEPLLIAAYLALAANLPRRAANYADATPR